MNTLETYRKSIRINHLRDERDVLKNLMDASPLSPALRAAARNNAVDLVRNIRADSRPKFMEVFLAEYGLSTKEGVALICLAEALLRVPDSETIDALIKDKVAPSSWGQHLGQSSSYLINASTWALLLTGKVLKEGEGVTAVLKGAVKRLGEPVIRTAVWRAIKEMGAQFILGQTIEEAVKRAKGREQAGFTYSYDMLGEAALTAQDAESFLQAYRRSISNLAEECSSEDIRDNPEISIKLSALHPRYEVSQTERVMDELVPVVLQLAQQAKAANMGLNIDAEEADRLNLSLDVIEAVLRDPSLKEWDGFGVVVQAYGKRASFVIDWLNAMASELDKKIMVRLVKGAYWDTEIKRAQVEGLKNFPVFTQKPATDISYICCAKKLLGMTDRIYPQFATHNAHTVAAILQMTGDKTSFEFQRLHGMGESLHDILLERSGTRCRIYAPVGAHRDLLAYLVRRLLENGANSSFVNQIVDVAVEPETVAADPFVLFENASMHSPVRLPSDIYGAERQNSKGWDLHNRDDLLEIEEARGPFRNHYWDVSPLTVFQPRGGAQRPVVNPTDHNDRVGAVYEASADDVEAALSAASTWQADGDERSATLFRAAELYEKNFGQLFAILTREAGKTLMDARDELREAVDFLRYYAVRGAQLELSPRGVIACISPWNFPLAIFTGQISAALAAGNAVVAKPADPTAITATLAVQLMHQAGVPQNVLQFLPGRGSVVGARLSADSRVKGVCFTGSLNTAQTINRAMAEDIAVDAPLIAETGGLNAMIVDSTALPEQAIKDIVASAFQSAGQRCSALRLLYIQEDVAETFLEMLYGAMDELVIGNPWNMKTDVGPLINEGAYTEISAYIDEARKKRQLLKELSTPDGGTFIAPTVLRVNGISDLKKEIFGPVMHVATFKVADLDTIVSDINESGFGLTFGMHSRIDDRIKQVTSRLNVGNIYINRNQVGAIVGSQPFGGEGLSGTGPKAGGPSYVRRFVKPATCCIKEKPGRTIGEDELQTAIDLAPSPSRQAFSQVELPGPTGESNILSTFGRGVLLCLGPSLEAARMQRDIALAHGCTAIVIAPDADSPNELNGSLEIQALSTAHGFDAVVNWGAERDLRSIRKALSKRWGAIIPVINEKDFGHQCLIERHICIDTTAAGGNASLLATS